MGLVNESLEDVLQPMSGGQMKDAIKKLDWDEKYSLIEELWSSDWESLVEDIHRYLGDWKFEEIMNELIYMKQNEQI